MDDKCVDLMSGSNQDADPLSGGNAVDRLSGRGGGQSPDEDDLEHIKKDFDLALVGQCFVNCFHDESTVFVEEYLKAYRELCR